LAEALTPYGRSWSRSLLRTQAKLRRLRVCTDVPELYGVAEAKIGYDDFRSDSFSTFL